MQYDVVIVGGGPAGLAAAIRLKQLAGATRFRVCVLEKGSEIGAHILSGAVMDPRALDELIPDWKAKGAPLNDRCTEDRFLFLTEKSAFQVARPVPARLLQEPRQLRDQPWAAVPLARRSRPKRSGVEIFPGFAAAEVLYDRRRGQRRRDRRHGRSAATGRRPRASSPAWSCTRKYTFFAEGCRGHLGRQLEAHFRLRAGADPQVYGIGLKELWEVQAGEAPARPGDAHRRLAARRRDLRRLVPLPPGKPPGRGRLRGRASATTIPTSRRTRNSSATRRTRPSADFFEGGKRVAYGARAISAGGLQSLPKLVFPGGALIGDDAGFLNASRIKGSHCAIKSGMLAAEAAADALQAGRSRRRAEQPIRRPSGRAGSSTSCTARATSSRGWRRGCTPARLMFGIDQVLFRGKAPWTLHHQHADHETLEEENQANPIAVPQARRRAHLRPALLGVLLEHQPQRGPAGPSHAEGPGDPGTASTSSATTRPSSATARRASTRSCEAGGAPRLQINAQNCVHCKTCDIKDPTQNIVWVAPEGGGGPNYPNM